MSEHEYDDTTARQLYDLGAEQATLGAMLLSTDAAAEIEGIVNPQAFYRPQNATIFRTVVDLAADKQPADVFAVAAALADAGTLGRVGGAPYLHELVAAVPTAANGPHYARIVADLALQREVDLRLRQALRMLHEGGHGTGVELLDRAQQMLAGVESATPNEDGSLPWRDIAPMVLEAIEQAAAHADQTPGLPTGLIDLDHLLNGLHPGQLVVIAARPGVGKSVALAGIAQYAAWRHKHPSLIFSLEMTKTELGQRLLAADTGVPLNEIRTGNLSDDQWTRVMRVAGESGEAPLRIDDTPNLTLADIRARARRHHRREGVALIGVDYLQLIDTPRSENRQVAVSGLSRGLKLLAKELHVPVVVVAQLNRGPEQRVDKRPHLSDLRESGAVEQDADVVILLHREDYYDQESPRAGEADWIVAKNRGGPTDTIVTAAQLHLARFASMAAGL